ncbi:MAG: hypothetical protein S4CHLAM37_15010 [Chlamydiia bacterium]|nr:hypothetical protein [Chlamydiia bacterium]
MSVNLFSVSEASAGVAHTGLGESEGGEGAERVSHAAEGAIQGSQTNARELSFIEKSVMQESTRVIDILGLIKADIAFRGGTGKELLMEYMKTHELTDEDESILQRLASSARYSVFAAVMTDVESLRRQTLQQVEEDGFAGEYGFVDIKKMPDHLPNFDRFFKAMLRSYSGELYVTGQEDAQRCLQEYVTSSDFKDLPKENKVYALNKMHDVLYPKYKAGDSFRYPVFSGIIAVLKEHANEAFKASTWRLLDKPEQLDDIDDFVVV